MLKRVKKRDGILVNFNKEKIINAVHKAIVASGNRDFNLSKKIADEVTNILKKRKNIPGVEDIQDLVELSLIKSGHSNVAKNYILYRKKREEVRVSKEFFSIKDELKLSINAARVLERRYLLKNSNGRIIESPKQMFERVAKAIANNKKEKEEFFRVMSNLEFLPNSPTLMNSGTKLGQLAACFVIPVEDSLMSIFDSIKTTALIHQSGGGTGFNFSKIRPEGDIVQSTKGIASGPVSFMQVFDKATEVIKQGSKRRGANMGILNYNHPDIIKFITIKESEDVLSNFNISVAVDDKFMMCLSKNKNYSLINPRTNKVVKKVSAKDIFDLITNHAWLTGDPGLIFIDEINRKHPLKEKINTTNPCGEQPLLDYESCNLGSINLSKFAEDGKINYKKLKEVIRIAVIFLDNVIDKNKYILNEIKNKTKQNRKIGLGAMGFAEFLIKLGIPYDSKKAIKTAEEIMKFINNKSKKISSELALKKGAFPNFKNSKYKIKLRNATTTTIAPTGTISIIAGCSSGIEPLFGICFIRNILGGARLVEINPLFEEIAKKREFYSDKLINKIAKVGSIQKFKEIPKDVRNLFVCAFDIKPEDHLKIQAAFQKYTDNAVSKTVNLPEDAMIEDVEKIYKLAYKLKCKGITIYRYGSRGEQVLSFGELKYLNAEAEYAGGCPYKFCPH